jgi:hypothetical protein
MPPFDYSDAPDSDLIPPNEIADVLLRIRPGGGGDDGLLTRAKDGTCEMLSIEYTVVSGHYSRRKFFENQIIEGTTQGQRDMAQHYYGVRKRILESAHNITKGDKSPQALAAYQADLKDFDGLCFVAKIGIEKGKPRKEGGNYDDKNIIAAVITPGQDDYHVIVQAPPFNSWLAPPCPRARDHHCAG